MTALRCLLRQLLTAAALAVINIIAQVLRAAAATPRS